MFEHVHAAAARNLFVIAAPWYAYRVNNPLPGSTSPHPLPLLLLPLEIFIDNSIEKWQAAHVAYA